MHTIAKQTDAALLRAGYARKDGAEGVKGAEWEGKEGLERRDGQAFDGEDDDEINVNIEYLVDSEEENENEDKGEYEGEEEDREEAGDFEQRIDSVKNVKELRVQQQHENQQQQRAKHGELFHVPAYDPSVFPASPLSPIPSAAAEVKAFPASSPPARAHTLQTAPAESQQLSPSFVIAPGIAAALPVTLIPAIAIAVAIAADRAIIADASYPPVVVAAESYSEGWQEMAEKMGKGEAEVEREGGVDSKEKGEDNRDDFLEHKEEHEEQRHATAALALKAEALSNTNGASAADEGHGDYFQEHKEEHEEQEEHEHAKAALVLQAEAPSNTNAADGADEKYRADFEDHLEDEERAARQHKEVRKHVNTEREVEPQAKAGSGADGAGAEGAEYEADFEEHTEAEDITAGQREEKQDDAERERKKEVDAPSLVALASTDDEGYGADFEEDAESKEEHEEHTHANPIRKAVLQSSTNAAGADGEEYEADFEDNAESKEEHEENEHANARKAALLSNTNAAGTEGEEYEADFEEHAEEREKQSRLEEREKEQLYQREKEPLEAAASSAESVTPLASPSPSAPAAAAAAPLSLAPAATLAFATSHASSVSVSALSPSLAPAASHASPVAVPAFVRPPFSTLASLSLDLPVEVADDSNDTQSNALIANVEKVSPNFPRSSSLRKSGSAEGSLPNLRRVSFKPSIDDVAAGFSAGAADIGAAAAAAVASAGGADDEGVLSLVTQEEEVRELHHIHALNACPCMTTYHHITRQLRKIRDIPHLTVEIIPRLLQINMSQKNDLLVRQSLPIILMVSALETAVFLLLYLVNFFHFSLFLASSFVVDYIHGAWRWKLKRFCFHKPSLCSYFLLISCYFSCSSIPWCACLCARACLNPCCLAHSLVFIFSSLLSSLY
jgi:hypothetical protein